MNAIVKRLTSLAAAMSLASCGGGGGGGNTLPSNSKAGPTPYTGPSALANFTWGADLMKNATYVGPASFSTMSVNVQLQMQDEAGLINYAREASDPHSALYRRWLTPQEIGDRFGASKTNVSAAASYFQHNGLGVGGWPQHLMMVVTGKQANLEKAFGTKFGIYREYGQEFIAPTAQPHFAQVVPVSAVTGLVHMSLAHTNFIRANNGQFYGMSPQQIRRAFDFSGPASAGYDGTGITIGVIGTGPIWKGDAAEIGAMYNTKVAPVTVVPAIAQTPAPINNQTGTGLFDNPTGLATPPPLTPPCGTERDSVLPTTTCNPEDGEAQLDTQETSSLAPGSSVLFYLAFNNQDCVGNANCAPNGIGVQGLWLSDDEIQQAIADNKADVLSLSYGQSEPSGIGSYYTASGIGPGPAEFAALASEGIAVFVSSGDNGAFVCFDPTTGMPTAQKCVSYPASDPSVVAVGGVNIPMDNAGNLPAGATITAWGGNTTAGGDGYADNSIGSGGGISTVFAATPGQQTIPLLAGMRGVPDVSMDADNLTGPLIVSYANFPGATMSGGAFGGTSVAAPQMAAAWAVVLQACKNTSACAQPGTTGYRLGNPSALFYSIYANSAQYQSTFFDVVAGTNGANAGSTYQGGYSAGPGYDLVTGMGVPFVGHLIDRVVTGANVP